MRPPKRFLKNSTLSTVTIENFVAQVAEGPGFETYISPSANQHWFIYVEKRFRNTADFLCVNVWYTPDVFADPLPRRVLARHRLSLQNWKYDDCFPFWDLSYEEPHYNIGWDQFYMMDRCLSEDFGLLKDGAVTLYVEIAVDMMISKYGITRFNFYDPFAGCVRISWPHCSDDYFVSKRMLMLHSPVFAEWVYSREDQIELDETDRPFFMLFLQMMHGVQEILTKKQAMTILKYAAKYRVHSVTQQLERDYPKIFLKIHPNDMKSYEETAQLKNWLKSAKSARQLQSRVRKWDVEMVNSEVLKAIAHRFFSFVGGKEKVWSGGLKGMTTTKAMSRRCSCLIS